MIRREIAIFLVVGILTVAIDFSVYYSLIYLGFDSVNIAKGMGFIGGSIFAYFANRFWTFKDQDTRSGSILRFAMVYIVGLNANVLINHFSIFMFNHFVSHNDYSRVIFCAFVLATGVSAALNFLGMKFFVFSSRSRASPSFPA
jgi:putative flippase GtrA